MPGSDLPSKKKDPAPPELPREEPPAEEPAEREPPAGDPPRPESPPQKVALARIGLRLARR